MSNNQGRKSFFNLRYPDTDKPVFLDQLGNEVRIVGMILSGNNLEVCLYIPQEQPAPFSESKIGSAEDWISILKQLDDPQIFELDLNGNVKAIHRKCMRQIGSGIQWTIFHRDKYRCMYCGKQGGDNGLVLTIDHFVPVELGGLDTENNLLTACRTCNKAKSAQHPMDWCNDYDLAKYSYQFYVDYLKNGGQI